MSGDTEPHLWDDAACRGKDQRWWFPPLDSNGVTREILLAKGRAVCRACPRLEQCLNWSLAQTNELQGLWAGLTAHDRLLRRRNERTARGGRWECDICRQIFSNNNSYAAHLYHCRRRAAKAARTG